MSMPYHKELLRSSVSLCFREFFVFRNKAKGVMTLGDVLQMDPKAIQWCATKFTGSEEIRNAAKLICEYAQQKASA